MRVLHPQIAQGLGCNRGKIKSEGNAARNFNEHRMWFDLPNYKSMRRRSIVQKYGDTHKYDPVPIGLQPNEDVPSADCIARYISLLVTLLEIRRGRIR